MADTATWTWDDQRHAYDQLSDAIGDWQGLPIPVEGFNLVLTPTHPLRHIYGMTPDQARAYADSVDEGLMQRAEEFLGDAEAAAEIMHSCRSDDVFDVVNHWYAPKRNADVYVIDRAGKRSAQVVPRSPDRSMDRLNLWLGTLGASDAWNLDAEITAMQTLEQMVTDRQFRHYLLTGSFLESSDRSRLTYVFRRLRPTIALTPRNKRGGDYMRCLAVLCLHPIGYYDRTWAGCMVPTDDVIAHLTMMRGDEAHYWAQANKHDPASPEAGI